MTNAANGNSSIKVRAILQQCVSASLQVQPATEDTPAEYVQIRRGLVVYICFLKGATQETVDKIVKQALSCRLSRQSEEEGGRLVSITDLPGDVLIVPQATLGGRVKGKAMQYHDNIAKDAGRELYEHFVEGCRRTMEGSELVKKHNCSVKWGTYGNLQVLKIDTNGPYTHVIEL